MKIDHSFSYSNSNTKNANVNDNYNFGRNYVGGDPDYVEENDGDEALPKNRFL